LSNLSSLNADTSWLLTIKHPSSSKSYNILIDPWLVGPQIDINYYFNRQTHAITPTVSSITNDGGDTTETEATTTTTTETTESTKEGHLPPIDAIIISHEFSDHCNYHTLKTADHTRTRVYAHPAAVQIIKEFKLFDDENIFEIPVKGRGVDMDMEMDIITTRRSSTTADSNNSITERQEDKREGDLEEEEEENTGISIVYIPTNSYTDFTGIRLHGCMMIKIWNKYSIVYSPHGIPSSALREEYTKSESKWNQGLDCLALLHGFNDITLGLSMWIGSALNLGMGSGADACEVLKARKWIRTHDEDKNGFGIVAWLLCKRDRTRAESQELVRKRGLKTEVLELGNGEAVELL